MLQVMPRFSTSVLVLHGRLKCVMSTWQRKKHVPILGTFFFSARLVKLHVSMYKAQSWLSLQEVGKGY